MELSLFLLNLEEMTCDETGFGAHITLVRSLELDHWNKKYCTFMKLGGNRRAREHFGHVSVLPQNRIEKYLSEEATRYKQILKSEVYSQLGFVSFSSCSSFRYLRCVKGRQQHEPFLLLIQSSTRSGDSIYFKQTSTLQKFRSREFCLTTRRYGTVSTRVSPSQQQKSNLSNFLYNFVKAIDNRQYTIICNIPFMNRMSQFQTIDSKYLLIFTLFLLSN
jgi:hypothetical protein